MLKMAVDARQPGINILDDPEIWVVDTGASCHSTGKQNGMVELTNGNGSRTRMGNGARVADDAQCET